MKCQSRPAYHPSNNRIIVDCSHRCWPFSLALASEYVYCCCLLPQPAVFFRQFAYWSKSNCTLNTRLLLIHTYCLLPARSKYPKHFRRSRSKIRRKKLVGCHQTKQIKSIHAQKKLEIHPYILICNMHFTLFNLI